MKKQKNFRTPGVPTFGVPTLSKFFFGKPFFFCEICRRATMSSTTDMKVNDEYYTPKDVWYDIQKYIPKGKTIWEPFNTVIDQQSFDSSKTLRGMGFKVIARPYDPQTNKNDFFSSNHGDLVVSNPPFSKKREVLARLKELGKPFILLLPHPTMNTMYFRELFMNDKDFGIIIPRNRIDFNNKRKVSSNCFECLYYCWKVGVRGINWVN